MTTAVLYRVLRITTLAGLLTMPLAGWASAWGVAVDEQTGLPGLSHGGGPAMQAKYDFWAADWRWTGFYSRFKVEAPGRYSLEGKNKDLDFDLRANILRRDDKALTWTFDLDAHSRQSNVKGGGLVFQFDPALVAGEMGAPQLLPGNTGWAWGKQDRHVEMRFEPPLAKVYFEQGNPSEVRAFFYQDPIVPGHQQVKATLTLNGDIGLEPTTTERFGLADPARWPDDQLDWQTSPVDLAFLNAPEKTRRQARLRQGRRRTTGVRRRHARALLGHQPVGLCAVQDPGRGNQAPGPAPVGPRLQSGTPAPPRLALGEPEHLRRRQYPA